LTNASALSSIVSRIVWEWQHASEPTRCTRKRPHSIVGLIPTMLLPGIIEAGMVNHTRNIRKHRFEHINLSRLSGSDFSYRGYDTRTINQLSGTCDRVASIVGDGEEIVSRQTPSFGSVLVQIALLDVVFSLDSVITAVGMVDNIAIMILAVMISVVVMMVFSGSISAFVMKHPSVKVLALSFLLMIGVMLVAEGFGTHFNKNYVYFAMAFSLGVELLNLRIKKKKVEQTPMPSNAGRASS